MAKKLAGKNKSASKGKTAPSSKTSSKKTTTDSVVKFQFKDHTKTQSLNEKIEFSEHNIQELNRYHNMLIDSVGLDSPLKDIVEVNAKTSLVREKMVRTAQILAGFRQDLEIIEKAKTAHNEKVEAPTVDGSAEKTDAPVGATMDTDPARTVN